MKPRSYLRQPEADVIRYCEEVHERIGFTIIHRQRGFPDLTIVDKDGRTLRAEVETMSIQFKIHGHPASECDLIICWEHNWRDCPVPVLELKALHSSFDPRPAKPTLFKPFMLTLPENLIRMIKIRAAKSSMSASRYASTLLLEAIANEVDNKKAPA